MNSYFKGIYAANIVPLKADKSIDTENLVNHVKEISNVKGIRGLLVNGHAGENFTLSANEQIQVLKTISAIGQSVMLYTGPTTLPTKKDNNDWYIGSSVKILKEKYDADYGLLFFVRDQFTSKARQATKIFAAFLGVQMAAAFQISYVALVDLENGKVVWYNHRISGDGDTREYDGAKELIDILAEDMPS